MFQWKFASKIIFAQTRFNSENLGSREKFGPTFFYKDKCLLNKSCLDKCCKHLGSFWWAQVARICKRFGPKTVSWTKLVWKNVASLLDHHIFVSIGCMPHFSLIGYVEDGVLRRYIFLAPPHTHIESKFSKKKIK